MLIKICGVTDPYVAKKAVLAGAHFIGIMCYAKSIRFVNMDLAQKIAVETQNAGGIPVAIFVEQDAPEIIKTCRKMKINTIQLHGEKSRNSLPLLPTTFNKFSSLTVTEENINPYLNAKRDFLLFDHANPGKGNTFNYNLFSYRGHFRFFLAGGLNPSNVKKAIKIIKPTGVDVSSGVEKRKGIKDLNLIYQFIEACQ